MKENSPLLLEFPCDFNIKIFGIHADEFEISVLTIIRQHIKELRENAISTRLSKDSKYLAMTVTIHVESKEQLDNLYRALNASPLVIMTL